MSEQQRSSAVRCEWGPCVNGMACSTPWWWVWRSYVCSTETQTELIVEMTWALHPFDKIAVREEMKRMKTFYLGELVAALNARAEVKENESR